MDKQIIERWELNKDQARKCFEKKHPEHYREIVATVVKALADAKGGYGAPDLKRIHEIDDGDYQGTLVYVIGETGYQPSNYWWVKVSYGSCSHCDTLQSIHDDGAYGDKPTKQQVADYMTLALHIVQGMKVLDSEVLGEKS